MTKPIVSAVGTRQRYQQNPVVLSKVTWANPYFIVPPSEQLKDTYMPINVSTNAYPAPYVYSFINENAAANPKFRVALTDYHYVSPGGQPGDSQYWFYDPISPAAVPYWLLKNSVTAIPNGLPLNPFAMANIEYDDNPYLVVADFDSAGNAGGTLRLVSMTSADVYTTVASLPIISTYSGFQAHVQDVYVDGERIFALIVNSTPVTSEEYKNSELREYLISSTGGNLTFVQQGSTVTLSPNAVALVPYTVNGQKYLFIPCIGGYQNSVDSGAIPPVTNNGANSSLSVVTITSTLGGTEKKAYVGSNALHDFRGIAIATNGTAYILTGDYYTYPQGTTPNFEYGYMQWKLYKTTATNLVTLAGNPSPGTIEASGSGATLVVPPNPTDKKINYMAYFWSIGICKNTAGADFLVFAKGANSTVPPDPTYTDLTTLYSHDELHFLKVDTAWSDTQNIDNSIIPDSVLNGSGISADGFAINSIDISVDGGGLRLKTAHHHHAHLSAIRAKIRAAEERK